MNDLPSRFNFALDKRSKAAIARAVGVDPQRLSNWVSRASIPSEFIFPVSAELGVRAEWLTTGKGEMRSTSAGTLSGNVVHITHKDGKPATLRKIPVVSFTTGGKWEEVVDNFEPGYAEDWILVPDNVSTQSFALILRGKSMQPTIPDGATIIVDPHASYQHRSVVIVRQNGDTEATCKRLVYEGNKIFIEPDNSDYGRPELLNDAVIVGVVKQVVMDL